LAGVYKELAMSVKRGDIGSWVFTVGLVAVAAVIFLRPTVKAPVPEVFTASSSTLEQAIDTASQSGKPVFAVATADWCGPCQAYKRGALSDPRVAEWVTANTEPVYINVDESPEAASRLGVRSIPATFMIKPDGTVVGSHAGGWSAEALLSWLDATKPEAVASR